MARIRNKAARLPYRGSPGRRKLRPYQVEGLMLMYIDGRPMSEIAHRYSISVSTAHVYIREIRAAEMGLLELFDKQRKERGGLRSV